jgi:serine/threonine-protein kinase
VISTYLIQKTIWLGMAGAIVIYGAFRIEALREAADRGRELGQYRLQRILGTGGMGSVYSAEHVLLRRPCAIKLIRPDRAADPGSLARFEREVQATAALTHPHVVRIYDYGRTDDGTFYCVMEYLSGVTLDQLVRQHGVLSADRTVFILRQLCSALAEAHAAGLTHRDVKPGNVIVRDGGRQADFATLLDFGLVLDRTIGDDKLTTEGTLIGTPSFMSPEQAAGETVDGRSDLYAIGAVGHFLLTGRPPFAGGSTIRTVAAVLTEPPPPLGRADVPENLEAVLRRCLAKRPAERFQSADELDAALAGCCCDDWSHRRAAEWWPGLTVNSDVAAAGSETGTLV